MSVGRCDSGYRSARDVIFLTAARFERQAENPDRSRDRGSRSEKIRSECADVHGAPAQALPRLDEAPLQAARSGGDQRRANVQRRRDMNVVIMRVPGGADADLHGEGGSGSGRQRSSADGCSCDEAESKLADHS
jgi:hypothetical protein